MGILYFFSFIKKNFGKYITEIKYDQTYESIKKSTDNLLIDMNGVFHNSAQKIYEYGNFKKPKSLLRPKKPIDKKLQELNFFKDVCKTIDDLVVVTKPNKRLVLCVDGCAPYSKAKQQRMRRFRSVNNTDDDSPFDTSSISVGTLLMDNLNRYIDWYIKNKLSTDENWQKLDIIYSSYKVPGEGEQSLLSFIRKFGTDEETYTINGLDADIIMLALVSHKPNFYVLREDLYDKSNKFLNLDIQGLRNELIKIMHFNHKDFNHKHVINDFVFLMYLAGNDFLPHIPSIEIMENGIEIMIDVYKNICKDFGHLTYTLNKQTKFIPKTLEAFLGTIAQFEQGILENKMNKKQSFFPDPLLEKHCKFIDMKNSLNINEYRSEYFKLKFPPNISEQTICHEYLEGLQWVLSYYTSGVPDWNWHFKYYYAPFAFHLCKHVSSFSFKTYGFSQPLTPFQQLLCIIPPKSAYLLPKPLDLLLTNDESIIKQKFCPDKIDIDFDGKRKDYEAIVLVPMIDRQLVKQEYFKLIDKVNPKDLHRNKSSQVLLYKFNKDISTSFKSFYGNISNCKVQIQTIDI